MGVLMPFLFAMWPPLVMAAMPLTLLGFAISGNVDRTPRGKLFLTATLVGIAGVVFSVMAAMLQD